MLIVKNTWFPFGGYSTINLFGILFTKSKNLSEVTLNHERIHSKQMAEMLWIGFYLWYGIEYLLIRIMHDTQHGAYRDVSFEEEAYNNERDFDYLKNRKHYAWWKYISAKSNGTYN